MLAGIAKVSSVLGSKLSVAITQVGTIFTHVKKSDVAEALIATWCIEFLRVRKVGGFNIVEILVISVLMLGVKTIIMEASRRRYGDKNRTYVMSNRSTQMGSMEHQLHAPQSRRWKDQFSRRFRTVD